jgi:hypothetical protein
LLPNFKLTSHHLEMVSWQLRTARIVRMIWKRASSAQRKDGDFLQVLLHFVWLNRGHDEQETTRQWRNRRVAEWVGVDEPDDHAILEGLRRIIRSLGHRASREIIATPSGLTWYYGAFRPRALLLVRKHHSVIAKACESVSRRVPIVTAKVKRVASLIDQLPDFAAPAGGLVSRYSGLSPLQQPSAGRPASAGTRRLHGYGHGGLHQVGGCQKRTGIRSVHHHAGSGCAVESQGHQPVLTADS